MNDVSEVAYKWTVSVNMTANGYRFPTEAEFEYAARYGDGTTLRDGDEHSGDSVIDNVAWYFENAGLYCRC